jgi:glycerol-3-phosphate acyltransferase PlsY
MLYFLKNISLINSKDRIFLKLVAIINKDEEMENVIRIAAIIIVGYLLGSCPTAIIVSKKFFGFDIRKKGSGNMGSTNAFRVLGWKWGLFVQIADVLKGVLAVIIAYKYIGVGLDLGNHTWFEDATLVKLIAGISAVSGHIWSVFVDFKGGKGVNTAAGMLIGIAPIDVGIALGIFLLALIFSGYVSLGSILAAVAVPSSMAFRYNILHDTIPGYHLMIIFFSALSLLLVFAHRANIKRLITGTESRFNKLHLIKFRSKK